MQQSSEAGLNPWLTSYIAQYRDKKSRYEIDKFLIESGYNPAEIELAWNPPDNPPINPIRKTKKNGWSFVGGIIGCVFGLLGILSPGLDLIGSGIDDTFAAKRVFIGICLLIISLLGIAAGFYQLIRNSRISGYIELIPGVIGIALCVYISVALSVFDPALWITSGFFFCGGIITLNNRKTRKQD